MEYRVCTVSEARHELRRSIDLEARSCQNLLQIQGVRIYFQFRALLVDEVCVVSNHTFQLYCAIKIPQLLFLFMAIG